MNHNVSLVAAMLLFSTFGCGSSQGSVSTTLATAAPASDAEAGVIGIQGYSYDGKNLVVELTNPTATVSAQVTAPTCDDCLATLSLVEGDRAQLTVEGGRVTLASDQLQAIGIKTTPVVINPIISN